MPFIQLTANYYFKQSPAQHFLVKILLFIIYLFIEFIGDIC